MTEHVFDKALALQHSDLRIGQFTGQTSPDYWNMVGPFGGTTAAIVLKAVLSHPDLLGLPIALTVNYAAALVAGPLEVQATAVRTNRSTQHWTIDHDDVAVLHLAGHLEVVLDRGQRTATAVCQITQSAEGGEPQVNTTATVVTAARRETWGTSDLPMPVVPKPAEVKRFSIGPAGVAWMSQYEMRPVSGVIPGKWDGSGDQSESMVWLRDAEPRLLDFASLASMSDMFYPRIWLRRAKHVPAGTVSITTYFHGDAADVAAVGTGYLLGRAVGQQFRNGFFDQAAQLWSEAGVLLATSNQIVYFKE